MVDRNRASSFDYPYADPDPYRDGVGLSDYGNALASGAAGVGSYIGSALRSLGELREDDENKIGLATEHFGRAMQGLFGGMQEDANFRMSPSAARAIQSTVTDPNFWSLSAISLKMTQMTPEIAASVIPAVLAPGAIASAAAIAATGGAISASSVVDELYRMTDELSDEQLQAQAPAYRDRRAQGIDEETARREYNAELRGLKPLITGVVGAVTNSIGPAGQAARVLRGEAASQIAGEVAEGVGRRIARGAGEAMAAEAVQGGVEGGAIQQGLVDLGSQESIDYGEVASQMAEGAILGGIFGGAAGAAGGRAGDSSSVADAVQDPLINQALGTGNPVEMPAVNPTAPNQPGAAIPAQGPAATPASGAVPPTTAQPSVSDAVRAVDTVEAAPSSAATVVAPSAPDPAQAAAIAAANPVTMRGNTEIQVETPPVTQPVPEATPTPEASPRPPVARPEPPVQAAEPTPDVPVEPVEPVSAQPEVAQTGPRILEDRGGEDYSSQWANRVQDNIRSAERASDVPEVRGRNRTQSELAQRAATRDGASQIAQRFPPQEGEAGILTRRPREVQAARALILDRAKAISQEADTMGLIMPKAFRNSADAEANYNPETLLVMEAKRLASRPNPTPADFRRFVDRELSIRSGDLDQAVAERRAEGDTAMRRGGDRTIDTVTEAETPLDRMTPEDIMIRAEEEGVSAPKPKATAKPATKEPSAEAQRLPPRIEKILDDIMVAGAAKRTPVVERVKKRQVNKPTPVAKSEPTAKAVVSAEQADRQSRVTSKVEDIKRRVKEAREKTNTNPTEAQKEAGNYAKGAVSMGGMTLRIETPKGAERRGRDTAGREWSVKMRHDYGYIEGSRGADGEPVDVYIGDKPDSTYVYVVDQVDPDTRAFDEHKVLMGFASEQSAMAAYTRGFSDDSGAFRMGDLRKMTVQEFKDWLSTDPSERAGMSSQDAAEVRAYMLEEAFAPTRPTRGMNDALPQPLPGYVRDPYSHVDVRAMATRSASDIMRTFDLSSLNGYQRAVAGQARRMLTDMVGNTPVHFISDTDMGRMAGRDSVSGVYSSGADGSDAIFVRASLMNDPDRLQHVVLHEATHAATLRAVMQDAKVESDIRDVMVYTAQAIEDVRVIDDGSLDYGLTDPTEFVAEVLSNPRAQALLAEMPAPDALVQRLGLDRRSIRSAWDALVHAVRRALGLPANSVSMLEAALRVTERSMTPRMQMTEGTRHFLIDGNVKSLHKQVTSKVNKLLNRPELQPTAGRPWLYRLRTMDSIARAADRLFGGEARNPFRKIQQLIEAQRVRATRHYEQATPLLQKTRELQQRYDKVAGENGQTVWDNYTALGLDETMSGVYADRPLSEQKHITTGPRDSWQRAQHPELARRYNALPAELKAHRAEMLEYFKDQQRNLSYLITKNRLNQLFDVPDPDGFAKRLHEGTETDADKALLGDAYDAIKAAGVLSKIDGPYIPLMRRGNWVVVARQGVTKPGNAREISTNEFEFTSSEAAEAWMVKQAGRPTMRTVYVDPSTGETFGVEDGQQVRLTAQDMGAEARYRVVVQDKSVEMFDSERDARARASELQAAGMQVDGVAPRDFNNYGAQAEALSPQIQRMQQVLERRADARNFTPAQKHELLQSISEMSLQMMASTRIQTRSLPRRNVAGASKDFTRNIHDYALAMGNHVSKLEIGPQLDAHIADASDYIRENRGDNFNAARQEIYNEVMQRVTMKDPRTEGGSFGTVVNRVLAVSFIDKLMSPSYSVINATQPLMITMPYLAANYGVGKSVSAMSKAYNDIGTLRTITEGLKATASKVRNGEALPTDPVSLIMGRLQNARERQMIEFMIEKGALDTDAGLEVSKLMQDRRGILGRFDGGVGYLEGIARQMPKAVEAINRTVSSLAAYRLEMERSGDHNKAIQFAYDTINKTQFNYSHTNAAGFMNHPMLRIATQFKKYGIGMYQHLGEQMGIAIDSTRTPQERAAAIKTLAMTIGMHVAVAGAMGLPTEPIKMVVTTLNAMGITDFTWTDVEIGQREALAGLFGKDVGEVLSRGIPRLAGIDLSTRMGIDTLMGPFGEPRSNEAQDLKAYFWDAVAGAPAGLIFDMTGGIKNLVEGDVLRGMERLVPVKAFSDTLKAYRQMTEGSVTESGKKVLSPYSAGEAALRAFGFAPSREAEAFERSNMFYHSRSVQEERRRDYLREWTEASGASRGRIWREIQSWNKQQPREVKLSLTDLRRYQQRMKADIKNTREGLRARRREQHILDRADKTFNFE